MDLAQFVSGIRFRHIQPDTPIPMVMKPYPHVHHYVQQLLQEMENAQLPDDQDRLYTNMAAIWSVPRRSSFVNGAIINYIVSRLRPGEAFVHAGTLNSFMVNSYHFFAGLINNPDKRCIGVDHFSRFGNCCDKFFTFFMLLKSPHHHFYDLDYTTYFSDVHDGPIGCYVLDGIHDYKLLMDGLQQAEPHFAKGCAIVVPDINWPETRQAALDFIHRNQGAYTLLLNSTTSSNFHPTFGNGLLLFQKK
ncbi:hypothetical protein [Paenibacillus sp. y28]|uniref:hypothetical protein n=1 Tax=Paenibacillus sp. y28 TaxID=3129110 RepID=UPI0030192E19